MKINRLFTACFLALLTLAAIPRAEALTYYLTESNAFGSWNNAIPPAYGYVDVRTGSNDWLFFEVGANSSFFAAADPGLTWDKFYFNFEGMDLDTGDIVVDEAGNWNVVTDKNVSEFGRFEFGVEGSAIGSNFTDPLRFRIETPGLNPEDFAVENEGGWLFAGHLLRFRDMEGEDSTFLAAGTPVTPPPSTPVPEPGTLLLIGAGLGSLAWRRFSR